MSDHTGIAAGWCDICGQCTCQYEDDAPVCTSCLGTGQGIGAGWHHGRCHSCGGSGVGETVGLWSTLLWRYIDRDCPLHGHNNEHEGRSL